ncbi:MCP four helix bundle domain-containing protein [Candidatus Nitrospira bockiana]
MLSVVLPTHAPCRPVRRLPLRVSAWQLVISLLIAALGLAAARTLSQVDADLQIIYQEYTLAAVDLAHISADVIRYRNTIIRALESPTKAEFEQLTASLAEQRSRIQHAVDRYAAASLRVARSGRSEPQDLHAVRASLDAYFASASRTLTLLIELWNAPTEAAAAQLRHEAEVHAADNAGPKLIQVSLALDRLLDTVSDVAKDLRDEGSRSVHETRLLVGIGAVVIAVLNLLPRPGPEARLPADAQLEARREREGLSPQ